MAATTDRDVLHAFAALFAELGADPAHMPESPWHLYRTFKQLGASSDVLALVDAWHDTLTNRELILLIGCRRARTVAHR